ncbi:MAG: SIMPL domain-containing protein [Oscillospiraceae bacterium]|nr:SIMPL domain-containing protein [Oscillospiraceae bacterium]
MSKFNVHGSAEQEFPAEQFKLLLTVHASDGSAGESIRKGTGSVEQLLQALSDKLGIQPEDLRLNSESASRSYGNTPAYNSEFSASLVMPAELSALHAVTALLESQSNAEYRVEYELTDRKAAEETVMRAAFADSRKKAELLAEMLGQKITGAEKVNYEFSGDEAPKEKFRGVAAAGCFNDRLADRMRKPVIRISKNVDITWLAE